MADVKRITKEEMAAAGAPDLLAAWKAAYDGMTLEGLMDCYDVTPRFKPVNGSYIDDFYETRAHFAESFAERDDQTVVFGDVDVMTEKTKERNGYVRNIYSGTYTFQFQLKGSDERTTCSAAFRIESLVKDEGEMIVDHYSTPAPAA